MLTVKFDSKSKNVHERPIWSQTSDSVVLLEIPPACKACRTQSPAFCLRFPHSPSGEAISISQGVMDTFPAFYLLFFLCLHAEHERLENKHFASGKRSVAWRWQKEQQITRGNLLVFQVLGFLHCWLRLSETIHSRTENRMYHRG